jgi:hypothetical protein
VVSPPRALPNVVAPQELGPPPPLSNLLTLPPLQVPARLSFNTAPLAFHHLFFHSLPNLSTPPLYSPPVSSTHFPTYSTPPLSIFHLFFHSLPNLSTPPLSTHHLYPSLHVANSILPMPPSYSHLLSLFDICLHISPTLVSTHPVFLLDAHLHVFLFTTSSSQ